MFASINKRLMVIALPSNIRLGWMWMWLILPNLQIANVKILIVHADGRIVLSLPLKCQSSSQSLVKICSKNS
jgi:hypothetical protein